MLCAGVVSGSSINGEFNGNPIVNVVINGNAVKSDVPAIIYEGSTLIPLRSASEALGAKVDWDGETLTAKITKAETGSAKSTEQDFIREVTDALLLDWNFKPNVMSINTEVDKTVLYFDYTPTYKNDGTMNMGNIANMALSAPFAESKIDKVRISLRKADKVIGEVNIDTRHIKDHVDKKITLEEFTRTWNINIYDADVSKLKMLMKVADYFRRMGSLGDIISGVGEDFRLANEGIKLGLDPASELKKANDLLNKAINTYNDSLKQTTNIAYEASRHNIQINNELNDITNKYNKAIDYMKEAYVSLENYTYTQKSSDFMEYLSNVRRAREYTNPAITLTLDKYYDFYDETQYYQ